MKQLYKIIGIGAIMLFSFYYTDKIALLARNNNPIMNKINDIKASLSVISEDAIVSGEYIIPGLNGLEVNANQSFANMQSFKEFNSHYLVFDQITPKVSINDNKDKIINQGNPKKRAVAFIIDNNQSIINYLINNNKKATILANTKTKLENNKFEYLNNEIELFTKMESILNRENANKHICLVNDYNKSLCINNNNYLVLNSLELNGSSIATIKNKISSGDIILIKESANLEDFKLLIKQIEYQDLNLVYLSELISEENN